jgi:hypothetical protein
VKHKSADQRAQYLKRVDRLLAVEARTFEHPDRDGCQQFTLAAPFR